jgi:oligopeptidase A
MLLVTTRKLHIHTDRHALTLFFFPNRYKYSETFSADAYGAFEEAEAKGGNEAVVNVGQRYRDTILALGGGTPPRQVWTEFRGRPTVDVNALLRHSGLQ